MYLKYFTLGLLTLATVGCSKQEAKQQATPAAQETTTVKQDKPKYIAAMYAGYPPFNFRDERGLPIGFDVDLMNEIAKNQGFEIEYITTNAWKELEPALNNGQRDLIVSSYWHNEDRAKNFELSKTYYSSDFVLMGKKSDNLAKDASQTKNKKIAFISGNTYQDTLYADIFANNNQPVKAKTTYLAFKKILQGKADFVLDTEGALRHYAKQSNINLDDYVFLKSDKLPKPKWVYVAKKGNVDMINQLNDGLNAIKANGTYEKVQDKWF